MKLIRLFLPEKISRGRLCSDLAKKLLSNPNIAYLIENKENIVVSGSLKDFQSKIKIRRQRGSRRWGPHYPRLEQDQIRRCLRGMVPRETKRGKEAYKRFFTIGEPQKIKQILLKRNIRKKGLETKEVLIEKLVFESKLSHYPPSRYARK